MIALSVCPIQTEVVERLEEVYHAELHADGDILGDFMFMKKAKRIVLAVR